MCLLEAVHLSGECSLPWDLAKDGWTWRGLLRVWLMGTISGEGKKG